MLGGRGAKGSIRDRLLSILYRIRYRKAIKKKKSLIKKNKIRIFNYIFFKSNFKLEKKCKPIRKDRTVSQKKIYYVRKRKVGIVPKENINNSEINIFVANSKLIVNEIKKDIVKIKKTESIDSNKLLNPKIILLSNEYYKFNNEEINKHKFEEELDCLKSIKNKNKGINDVEKSIDNYQKKLNNIENKKTYKQKKDETKIIGNEFQEKSIKITKNKKSGIVLSDTNKKIVRESKFDNKIVKEFDGKKDNLKKIDALEEKIKREVEEQKKILNYISSKANEINIFIKEKIVISGISKIFSSLLKIAFGFLTLPFSGKNIFGIMLGSSLVNKGIRNIRKCIKANKYSEVIYNYEDLKYKIENSKDKLKDTKLILDDSIEQLQNLKEEFKEKFSKYKNIIPEYDDVFKKIDKLSENLNKKKREINDIDKNLDKQYEINKIKLKKVDR